MKIRLSAALLVAALPLYVGAAAPHQDLAAAPAQAIFKASEATSAIVVVVTPESTRSYAFGPTAPGGGRRANETSLIRINSTSKLLAAHLALKMSAAGLVNLDAPYGKSAPFTLRQLITHTSGLPRAPGIEDPADAAPYTWPTAQVRSQWLAEQKPVAPSGRSALYSNVGYDLLADALALSAGKPYPVLLREGITGPLGMTDTTSSPTAEQCGRLLKGAADTAPCVDTSATAGTGGMYSTPRDMATWMRYMLGLNPRHKPQADALDVLVSRANLTSVTNLDKGGPPNGIGYGWVALAPAANQPAIMQKTGGGVGFMSYMALAPEQKVGVFVAVSRVDMAMMDKMVRQTLALVSEAAARRAGAIPAGPASRP